MKELLLAALAVVGLALLTAVHISCAHAADLMPPYSYAPIVM